MGTCISFIMCVVFHLLSAPSVYTCKYASAHSCTYRNMCACWYTHIYTHTNKHTHTQCRSAPLSARELAPRHSRKFWLTGSSLEDALTCLINGRQERQARLSNHFFYTADPCVRVISADYMHTWISSINGLTMPENKTSASISRLCVHDSISFMSSISFMYQSTAYHSWHMLHSTAHW